MFSFVPTSAALPAENEFHALLASAKATADAVRPYLVIHKVDGTALTCTIRKVVSCQRFYTALLRSDGTLLLLLQTTNAGDKASAAHATCAASVSVLESGGEAVVDVAAGWCHIVYCTASGAVYSCGFDNTYGQLGDGTVWSSSLPLGLASKGAVSIPSLSPPKRIAGFGETSSVQAEEKQSRDSDISTGGAATEGSPSRRYVPPPCSRRIRNVACGAQHTLLLTYSGRCVYACGRGDCGELGGARAVLLQPSFRSISLLFGLEVRQVAAADAHSFVLLQNGLLYAFGDNVCGQLGLGHTKRVTQPTFVPLFGQEANEPSQRQQQQQAASKNASVPNAGARPLTLDEKAYVSLRAPYNSVESTYYPLRVPRLQAHGADSSGVGKKKQSSTGLSYTVADNVDTRVRWVHCSGSWTLLETDRPDVWLSCGAVLTRGVASLNQLHPFDVPAATTAAAAAIPVFPAPRIDGCGVLGRSLLSDNIAEAYRFLPVQWAAVLSVGNDHITSWNAQTTPPAWTRNEMSKQSGLSSSLNLEEGGGANQWGYDTTTNKGVSVHQNTLSDPPAPLPLPPPHRSSDAELTLCHTKETLKAEEGADGVRVSLYPTSLLVLSGSGDDADSWAQDAVVAAEEHGKRDTRTGLITLRLLVQSGAPSAIAVKVLTKDASTWKIVTGCAAETEVAAGVAAPLTQDHTPWGAFVLRLPSSHGQFIPLPSYALVL